MRLISLLILRSCPMLAGAVQLGVGQTGLPSTSSAGPPPRQAQPVGSRRVNAPHFDGDVHYSETAILWFGQVTPIENYADVRVGYNDSLLFVNVAVFDRRLWYDTGPTPGDLTSWDAVSLYLNLDGNVGEVPDANAYRFDAQLVWWEPRDAYQAAYQGNGFTWISATVPFTTTSGWRGDTSPNNDHDDRGWWLTYPITFNSLGLSGPPPEGTVWGLALMLHDRDDDVGTPIDDKAWPEAMDPFRPVTWGQLAFGMPAYVPPPTTSAETITIRHGLGGATVIDVDVGGGSDCGQSAWPDFFSTWGALNYASKDFANIQNQGDVADWPCFSKFYVTFPLDSIPVGRVVISATLTLHLWGGAGEGWDPEPQPSLIQVLVVQEGWDESTITWNNAPLALENMSATWVEPVESYPGRPGIPYHWDVSRAIAQAHGSGAPARLVLYESDWAYQSGKYFDTSDVDDWGQVGRPTLTVKWGNPLVDLDEAIYLPLINKHQ